MYNLASLLTESARRSPAHTAMVFGEKRLNYAELNGASSQVANRLRAMGIQPGDHVALTCPNLPYFPIIYYGILKAGAVVVPLNVLLKQREIAYHLQDADCKAYFCFEGTAEIPMGQEGFAAFQETASCEHFILAPADPTAPPALEGATPLTAFMADQSPHCEVAGTRPEDTAVILYTSGTTGQPKGAELTQANMVMNALVTARLLSYAPSDVGLIVLPLFHSFGQTVLMNAMIYAGGTSVLLSRLEPGRMLQHMQDEGVTAFSGVPSMYWALLNYPKAKNYDLNKIATHLRVAISGGAALPVEVLHAFEEKFDVPILEGYGLSESSPVACFNQLDQPRKPGSIGTPIWGVEMRIADSDDQPLSAGETGEVLIRGHNIMKGYYNRAEENQATLRNGWLHTGDIGTMDEDGYFYIVDRLKDMVIRAGFNVYPREIEEVLVTHPAVSMAAVIGVPDPKVGEEIKACVVLAEGAEITESELGAWCRKNMAQYKFPRRIEIHEALPMSATGKILKREAAEVGRVTNYSQPAQRSGSTETLGGARPPGALPAAR